LPASRLIFLGPPGTGKGTQSGRIARRYSLTPLSSGDILRNEVRAATAVGQEARVSMDRGLLVPDELIIRMMLGVIHNLPEPRFILDGFPRTVPQAEALAKSLAADSRPVELVIDFRIADAVVIDRIVYRRICSVCQFPYNVRFSPPRVAGVCDRCGGSLMQRSDDREDVVRTRLEAYRRQTAPLVEHYQRLGLLRTVDAAADADIVEQSVASLIEAS
jgi:adenylate kinase